MAESSPRRTNAFHKVGSASKSQAFAERAASRRVSATVLEGTPAGGAGSSIDGAGRLGGAAGSPALTGSGAPVEPGGMSGPAIAPRAGRLGDRPDVPPERLAAVDPP